MNYLMITNDPNKAVHVVERGVRQVFIDMETLGKEERQKGRGAVYNQHSIEDVRNVCRKLEDPFQNVLVRINPYNANTFKEIDAVLEHQVGFIMLPFFKTFSEVSKVREYINGRTKLCLLFETVDSLSIIDRILQYNLCDQLHFGLNDLSIELGYRCIFKVLYHPDFINAVQVASNSSVAYGIGGVGKVGVHEIPAEMLLKKYLSLGSSYVILSRAFNSEDLWADIGEEKSSFCRELEKLNKIVELFDHENIEEILSNDNELIKRLDSQI